MWLLRKLEKLNWSDRISNEEVLTMVNESRCLIEYGRCTPKEEKLDRTCAEREWTVNGYARRKNVRKSSSSRRRENAG